VCASVYCVGENGHAEPAASCLPTALRDEGAGDKTEPQHTTTYTGLEVLRETRFAIGEAR
jgi:hypothetical protein